MAEPDNPGSGWVEELVHFLREEPGISAVRIDPAAHRLSVATVGNTVQFATGTVNVATLGILGSLTGIGENIDPGTNSCAGALGAALSGKASSSPRSASPTS